MSESPSRPTPYMFFGMGAALGSALGLVIGLFLTFWFGEGLVRMIQRGLRRFTGRDDRPSLDVFMQ